MNRLRTANALVVFWAMLVWPFAADAAPCSWPLWKPEKAYDSAIRSPLLISPDGRTLAWSVIFREEDELSGLVWSSLFLRDFKRGKETLLARTGFVDGVVVPVGRSVPIATHDTFHELCPIDWSPDGQRLLVYEMTGPFGSDHVSVEHWIFAARGGPPVAVELSSARKDAETRLRHDNFELNVRGWHQASSRRLVLEARGSAFSGYDFLGYWAIGEDGSSPQFLGNYERSTHVRRFSRIIGPTPME